MSSPTPDGLLPKQIRRHSEVAWLPFEGDRRMNTRIVGLSRFGAAICATMITAVGGCAFVNSTASVERDPFQFASFIATNAGARSAQSAERDGERLLHEGRVYGPFGLLVPLPQCVGECA
jgi:hypothetical protein